MAFADVISIENDFSNLSNDHHQSKRYLFILTELPGCLFEVNHCAWESSDNWRMSKLSPLKSLEKDWQNTLGTYRVSLLFNKPSEAFLFKLF